MTLRKQLEGIEADKVAQEESAKKEALLTEDEKAKQEESKFLNAYARKHTVSEKFGSFQDAKNETQSALNKRREEFKNITGLMEQVQTESSFKDVIANPETGSDEAHYVEAKESASKAILELRTKKAELGELGVDADRMTNEEILQAVQEVQAEAEKNILEFLVNHPESELPEAVKEREEKINSLETKIDYSQQSLEQHTEWGKEHVSQYISTFHENLENLLETFARDISWAQDTIDNDRTKLAQISLYRDILEGTGVMQDPEVVKTYEPAVKANNEVQDIQNELHRIKGKPTSKFFGYTESKKQEELSSKQRELEEKKEEARQKNEAYDSATKKFSERYRKAGEIYGNTNKREKGHSSALKKSLEESIVRNEESVTRGRDMLKNADYYVKTRKELLTEVEEQKQLLAKLKGEPFVKSE